MDVIRGDGSLLKEIDLAPANVHQAVLQNIAVILDTVQGPALCSVILDCRAVCTEDRSQWLKI